MLKLTKGEAQAVSGEITREYCSDCSLQATCTILDLFVMDASFRRKYAGEFLDSASDTCFFWNGNNLGEELTFGLAGFIAKIVADTCKEIRDEDPARRDKY